jgi:hypothetical protein
MAVILSEAKNPCICICCCRVCPLAVIPQRSGGICCSNRQSSLNSPSRNNPTHSRSPNQLQIVRPIRNRSIPKLSHNLRPLQEEQTLLLVAVFFDRPNSMLEDRAPQPPLPNRRLQQRQPGINPRQLKHRSLIDLRLWIAHPLHIPNPLVVEERLRALRRSQMHKHRPHPTPRQLITNLRNIADRLTAKRAPKVSQKDKQHRRSLHQRQQTRTRLRMNRSQQLRNIVRRTHTRPAIDCTQSSTL